MGYVEVSDGRLVCVLAVEGLCAERVRNVLFMC